MIGGIQNGVNNQNVNSHVHHVTECIHEEKKKTQEGMTAGLRDSVSLQTVQNMQIEEPQWNLFQWMSRMLGRGARGIKGFFGIGQEGLQAGSTVEDAENTGAASTAVSSAMESPNKIHAMTDRAAGYFVPAKEEIPSNNWYQNLKERARIRFGAIRNSLSKYLKQEQSLSMGAGKNGTSAGREKEDRSRLSVYKKDELEIDCIITDDSYLLDSYNRKGDYSRLGDFDTATYQKYNRDEIKNDTSSD